MKWIASLHWITKKSLKLKKITMEVSEQLTHMPLDFSLTMMNLKIKHELNNNTILQQNNQSSSAFKVVTPRGKTDG